MLTNIGDVCQHTWQVLRNRDMLGSPEIFEWFWTWKLAVLLSLNVLSSNRLVFDRFKNIGNHWITYGGAPSRLICYNPRYEKSNQRRKTTLDGSFGVYWSSPMSLIPRLHVGGVFWPYSRFGTPPAVAICTIMFELAPQAKICGVCSLFLKFSFVASHQDALDIFPLIKCT